MKRSLFFLILRKLKEKPHLKRKLKIFITVGLVGFLFVGAMTLWAGYAAFNYVASLTTQAAKSPEVAAQIENVKTEVSRLPHLEALSCWNHAQSLMHVQPWLERPIMDNLTQLKGACLQSAPAKTTTDSIEGSFI